MSKPGGFLGMQQEDVVGVNSTIAYNKDGVSVEYTTETESTSSFTHHDQQLVVRDGGDRVGALNLESGELGP